MKTRTLTAIIGLLIFIPILIIGPPFFSIFVLLLSLITLYELLRMTGQKIMSIEGFLTFVLMIVCLIPDEYYQHISANLESISFYYAICILLLAVMVYKPEVEFSTIAVLALSALYVGRGYQFLILGREMGLATIAFMFLLVWGNDTCAYLGGSRFGRRPQAPKISPNKTIEGSLSGILGGLLISFIFTSIYPLFSLNIGQQFVMTIILGITGQLGDLVESAMKRQYQVKDSGHILPGHGGLLDRFDSMLFVLPMFHFILTIFKI